MHSSSSAVRWPAHLGLASLAVLATLAASCQPEEQPISGKSWDCTCQLVADLTEIDAHVCAMTASEAAATAAPCVEAARGEVLVCDCIESATWFCELGECVIQ